jgi:hypothetical protein
LVLSFRPEDVTPETGGPVVEHFSIQGALPGSLFQGRFILSIQAVVRDEWWGHVDKVTPCFGNLYTMANGTVGQPGSFVEQNM